MSIPGSFHQQYPVTVAFSQKLQQILPDAVLHEAYTLSREELVLVFKLKAGTHFSIRIVQQYQSCFILTREEFPEKGSNAQPVFETIFNETVSGVEQHPGNRSFAFQFGETRQLVFKMYGGLVNVLLFSGSTVTDMFRDSITRDRELTPDSFKGNVASDYPVARRFYIYQREHKHPYYLAIAPQPDLLVFESHDVLEALNEFSRICLQHYLFATGKQQILDRYRDERNKLEVLIAKTREGIQAKQSETSAEEIAHIIMANLHAIAPKSSRVELYDFYRDQPVIIKLKEEWNAQENAAYYYRKHKNAEAETAKLEQKLTKSSVRLNELNTLISAIENTANYKDLKKYLPTDKEKKQPILPYRQFEFEGFLIWVGKSAAGNDQLTMRYAHKNDLWLHAKDVSGSHVLVKWRPGKEFSKNVTQKAAELAAYYSKLKGSALVPVSYTPKKYVRKPKGAEPGQVIVEKEEVIMVAPKLA